MPPSEAKTQRSSKSRHGLWTGAHPLQLQHADARSDWFGEIELIEEPKRKRRQSDHARAGRERTIQENALDEALEDTFPASDPLSAEQPVSPTVAVLILLFLATGLQLGAGRSEGGGTAGQLLPADQVAPEGCTLRLRGPGDRS
jgi:hypothetical protein